MINTVMLAKHLAVVQECLHSQQHPLAAVNRGLCRALCEQVAAEQNVRMHGSVTGTRRAMVLRYAVYPGAEKVDLGPKRPTALCESKQQGEAMVAVMWPGHGYVEMLPVPVLIGLVAEGDTYSIPTAINPVV